MSELHKNLTIDDLQRRINKIYHGKITYALLSLRQVRRLVRLLKLKYGNLNMMDFHTKVEYIKSYDDLPF
jgi:hypothetical protein